MIVCQICGFQGTMLGRHVRSKHDIEPKEYLNRFPGHILTDKSLREKMSNSNNLKGKVIGSLSERYGDKKAAEIKEKIGTRSGAARRGVARPKQGETLKRVWAEKREEWSAAIAASYTPERRARASEAMRKHILEHGRNFFWGQESSFEILVRAYFEGVGLTVQKQYRVKIDGVARYYDMFIPAMNMLVECDGEFWHSKADRVAIDQAKNKWAQDNGFTLLRLSDKEFPFRIQQDMSDKSIQQGFDIISERVVLAPDELLQHAIHLVESRKND